MKEIIEGEVDWWTEKDVFSGKTINCIDVDDIEVQLIFIPFKGKKVKITIEEIK